MASRDSENVHNRTTHAWSLFENHAELAFIEVEWLEQYRERRKEIVRRRIVDAQARGETLPKALLGGKEETVVNKVSNPKDTSTHDEAPLLASIQISLYNAAP